MSVKITWNGNNITYIFKGNLSQKELLEGSNHITSDERFDTMEYAIFDLLDVKEHNYNQRDIRIVSIIDKGASRWNKKLKLACIANHSYAIRHINEYKTYMLETNWKIEIFENMDVALVWCRSSS